jgi:hypothetical protein
MSKTDWDSPPESPTHASDIFGTSEAVAAEAPAPEVPEVEPPGAEQPPAAEQPTARQMSAAMQVKHDMLKTLFKQAYDQARA